jgi:hypothetical protein
MGIIHILKRWKRRLRVTKLLPNPVLSMLFLRLNLFQQLPIALREELTPLP